jgi:hypothetical protein
MLVCRVSMRNREKDHGLLKYDEVYEGTIFREFEARIGATASL